jgi:hypothetical protein
MQNEVHLVHQFNHNHYNVFHTGALGRVDEYDTLRILARLLRQIRGCSLREIIDSHQENNLFSFFYIQKLWFLHAASHIVGCASRSSFTQD